MKFDILLVLVCTLPVALSHERYVAIPISALKNGKLDSQTNQFLFDVNPLQIYTRRGGATQTGSRISSGRSTGTRTTRLTGGGSGESLRRQSVVTGNGITAGGSVRSVATNTFGRNGNIIPTNRGVTLVPIGSGRMLTTNVRYVNNITPSHVTQYVNSVSQPHTSIGTGYRPLVTGNGYYRYILDWPLLHAPSYRSI